MMRNRLVGVLLSAMTLPALAESEATPAWIWVEDRGVGEVEVYRDFEIGGGIDSACLILTGDFAEVSAYLNDHLVAELEAFDPVAYLEVGEMLLSGTNRIRLRARGVAGPSAMAARLTVNTEDGPVTVETSKDWRPDGMAEFGRVLPARFGPNVLPEIETFAEYNQWKDALEDGSARSLSVFPNGFSVSEIYAAKEEEGSWVSLVTDPQGRLVIGREDRGLLRFTLSPNGAGVSGVETINETLEECRGLVFQNGTLYANANRAKGLYRLRDTTGDDQFDEVVLVQTTEGGPGHGRNGLILGPDGAVHSIHGDNVQAPQRSEYLVVPEPGEASPLGHWLTIGPEGKDWTMVAGGLRNPYGIDFNRDGEAFTYDADNEGDLGLPFYRPTRINHLVAGGNYGWQQRPGNTRSLPVYAPDSLPTTYDVGRGSPTGVKFGAASNFPEPWRSALYALDWAYGRIVVVHLVPRGAGYYATGEVFLEGRPLNVTDLDFANSGDLYFVTGGRKTRSALYRVSYEGGAGGGDLRVRYGQGTERGAYSGDAREVRRRIEAERGPIRDFDDLSEALGSKDPWMRNAARVRLEKRSPEEWIAEVPAMKPGLARLTAFLALSRQGNNEQARRAVTEIGEMSGDGWNQTEKLTWLRIAELGLERELELDSNLRRALASGALSWITEPSHPITREAVRVLSMLDDAGVIDPAMLLLTKSETQGDRLHYLEMLSRVSQGWTGTSRRAYFAMIADARQTSRGDRFMPPFFKALEQEALDAVSESERETYAELLDPEVLEEPEPAPARPFVRHWVAGDFAGEEHSPAGEVVPEEVGKALFVAGQCHRCHTFGLHGHPIGPDLTRVGSRFSFGDLLESILDPSAVVAEVYRNVSLELNDGSTITGRLLRDDFRQSTLYLATNPFSTRDLTQVGKDRVVSMVESEISPMPPALLSGFTREEVTSLVQWLLQGPRIEEK